MRLLRIEIEGITSLKEKTVIDFINDLEGEDLFAITGPTGSGKSTILNCISIALYYKSHKDLPPENYVSIGSKKGRIKLDFEIYGDKYTSIWECSLYGVRGKKLKDPKPIKEFYKNDQPVDLKKSTPESIIGLDEDQFQKTVIINQGKFSDFITSSFKERKVLIEKIYTAENITNFPSFLNKEISTLNSNKELKESTIQGGLPITEKEFQINNEREAEISREIENYNQQKDYIQIIYENIKEIIENATKINTTVEDIKKIKIDLSQITKTTLEHEQKLKVSNQSLYEFEKIINKTSQSIEQGLRLKELISTKDNEIKACKKSLSDNENTLEIEKKRHNEINEDINDLKERLIKLEDKIKYKVTKEKIYNIEIATKKAIKLKTELSNLEESVSNVKSKIKESEARGQKLSDELNLLQEETNKISKGEELATIEKEIEQIESTKNKLSLIEMKINDSQNKIITLDKDLQVNNEQKDEIEHKILNLREHETSTLKKIDLIKKELKLKAVLNSIKQCTIIANDKNECPVCGNKEFEQLKVISEEFDDLDMKEKELEELNDFKDNQANDLKAFELELEKLNIKMNEKTESITQLSSYINEQLNNLDINYPEDQLNESFAILKNKNNESISKAKNKQKQLVDLKSKIALKDNEINNERRNYSKLKNELDILKKNYLSKETINNENSKTICRLINQEEVPDINELNYILNISREYLEIQQSSQANQSLLKNQDKQLKRIELLIQKLSSEKYALVNQQDLHKKEYHSILSELGVNDLQELKKENDTKHRVLLKKKEEDTKKVHDFQLKKGHLTNQIQYKEENLEGLENLVLRYINNIEKRIYPKTSQNELREIESKVKKIISHESAYFEDWEIENISAFYDDTLSYHFHRLDEIIRELRDECIKIKTLNSSYLNKVEEFQRITQEIKHIDRLISKKQKIKDVLGRDEFTRFAISMIEDQLILMANRELEKLCDGRYVLFQQEVNKTRGPEFFIRDLWRSSAERPLQSLSGGETFMVSLAMALGLAEMSRGQTEINTFFIDEGFGTLDQDSLEEVLNTLMNIRSRGKQIGIISHIKELTDRLPIRLQLNKNQLGESNLEISTY